MDKLPVWWQKHIAPKSSQMSKLVSWTKMKALMIQQQFPSAHAGPFSQSNRYKGLPKQSPAHQWAAWQSRDIRGHLILPCQGGLGGRKLQVHIRTFLTRGSLFPPAKSSSWKLKGSESTCTRREISPLFRDKCPSHFRSRWDIHLANAL